MIMTGFRVNMTKHMVMKSLRGKACLAAFIFGMVLYFAYVIWPDTCVQNENLPIVTQDFVVVNKTNYIKNITDSTGRNASQDPRYLLNSPSCRIPNLDPFSEEAMRLFNPVEYASCNDKPILTRITRLDNGSFAITTIEDAAKEYHTSNETLNCCYESITRGVGENADREFLKSKCVEIVNETVLDESVEFLLVTCKVENSMLNSSIVVYKDAHAMVPQKPDVRIHLDKSKSKRVENNMERPPSVLMFGIDSVSRLNYRRVMPNTLQHLQSTGWVELNAYNKIDDNTFPNLMAMFTGYNESEVFSICKPYTPGEFDKCSLIWRDFHDKGYVTAYAEDAPRINTFNYDKMGFVKQPTDYYSRPYFLAMASYLEFKYFSFCLGSTTESERIINYMTDFTTTFKTDPYFGIFWINTLCHDTLEMPPSMDIKIKQTFVELSNSGVLNDSIVFFFSDHGLRFGPIRELATGLLEERLPFMHIWIPEKFRASHSSLFDILKENSNMLTTPYDIHMTLQHILSLSSDHIERPSRACPNCNSIFKPIPFERTCAEASINAHWCTCEMYEPLNIDDTRVKAVAEFIVLHINNVILDGYSQCQWLELHQVLTARGGTDAVTGSFNYLIVLEAVPGGAKFETTVITNADNKFEIQRSPSRINAIDTDGKCVDKGWLKLYCHCEE